MILEKIDDFLECYYDAYGINNELVQSLIKEAILLRYNKYIKILGSQMIYFETNEDYIIVSHNNHYSLEDFLLNRLFQNLRYISLEGFSVSFDHDFTCFDSDLRGINFPESFQKDIEQLNNDIGETAGGFILQKIFDHEVGHSLKTKYTGNCEDVIPGIYKIKKMLVEVLKDANIDSELSKLILYHYDDANVKFIRLIEKLKTIKDGKYSQMIISPDNIKKETGKCIGTGIQKAGVLHIRFKYIDELFQEIESVLNVGQNNIHYEKLNVGSDGNYINIPYDISAYKYIIMYGEIMMSIFGLKEYFNAAYLNDETLLEEFDKKYYDISCSVFANNKSPLDNINDYFSEILKYHNESMYLKLDLFFSMCYSQMIKEKLKYLPNIQLSTILEEISLYQSRLTTNDDPEKRNKLPHNIVLNELKDELISMKEKIQKYYK